MGYEFSATENATIRRLAAAMRFVGFFFAVAGTAEAGAWSVLLGRGESDIYAAAWRLLEGVFLVLAGVWTWGAAKSFAQIVTTSGRDIAHLMQALERLARVYALMRMLLLAALVVGGMVGLAVLTKPGKRAEPSATDRPR
jgi:hypothetical protein